MPAPRALHAIVYHAVQLLRWFQVLIKGNVACDTVHLNMPRIHKFFYLWWELTFQHTPIDREP